MAFHILRPETVSMPKVKPRFKRQPGDHPGHFLRQWREFRGYKQEQVAEMLDITAGALSQLENGRTGYTQAMLEALAEVYGTDAASLVMRDPTRQEAIWSLWDRAGSAQREKIEAMAEIMLKDGTSR